MIIIISMMPAMMAPAILAALNGRSPTTSPVQALTVKW